MNDQKSFDSCSEFDGADLHTRAIRIRECTIYCEDATQSKEQRYS